MRGFLVGGVLGLILGVILAVTGPGGRTPIPIESETGTEKAEEPQKWRLVSVFSAEDFHSAGVAELLASRLSLVTDKKLTLELHGGGAIIPSLEVFDAVASGTVEAGISSPAYWGAKAGELQLFGGVPFGPDVVEFLAWFETGGGNRLFTAAYREHNIHAILCGVSGPTGGGWYTTDIRELRDLKDKTIAAVGLTAKVLERLGAQPVRLASQDIFPALRRGEIAGATFPIPHLDQSEDLPKAAKHFYFPGWSQPFSTLDLLINLGKWNALPAKIRADIEQVCSMSVIDSLAQSEGRRFAILKFLVKRDVVVKRWPSNITDGLRTAWQKERRRLKTNDKAFQQTWRSLTKFREDYAIWRELGYL